MTHDGLRKTIRQMDIFFTVFVCMGIGTIAFAVVSLVYTVFFENPPPETPTSSPLVLVEEWRGGSIVRTYTTRNVTWPWGGKICLFVDSEGRQVSLPSEVATVKEVAEMTHHEKEKVLLEEQFRLDMKYWDSYTDTNTVAELMGDK